MTKDIDQDKLNSIRERIEAISSSRPVLRLFEDHKGFLLRYGQSTDIDPSLSVKLLYADVIDADNDKLREIIVSSIPSKIRLKSDIDDYTEKQKVLISLLHNAADNHQWDEVSSINSKLKWVSSELECLRVTLFSVIS